MKRVTVMFLAGFVLTVSFLFAHAEMTDYMNNCDMEEDEGFCYDEPESPAADRTYDFSCGDEAEETELFYLDGETIMTSDITAEASSYFVNNNPSVAADKAFDGKADTSWDSWGEHEGAELTLTLPKKHTVSGFCITSGKPARNGSRDYYYRNSRPRVLRVYGDDELIGTFTIRDTWSIQCVTFSNSASCSTLRFVIDEVFEGTEYANPNYGVCISEISLF